MFIVISLYPRSYSKHSTRSAASGRKWYEVMQLCGSETRAAENRGVSPRFPANSLAAERDQKRTHAVQQLMPGSFRAHDEKSHIL
jgi:hypothetical protein